MSEFTQKLKFGKSAEFSIVNESSMKLELLNSSVSEDYKKLIYQKVQATWIDNPLSKEELNLVSEEDLNKVLMEVLSGKTLPNSLESISFDFVIKNIPLVEITHLLRHRVLRGIHAQCTGDRDLRDDNFFCPTSIYNEPGIYDEYVSLMEAANKLYCKMVDSKNISIMDARYVLPRSSVYFYYFTCNLNEAIQIINQRKCTMIQPEMDNLFAKQLYEILIKEVPELKLTLSLDCNSSCHYVKSDDSLNTRLYAPDGIHYGLLVKQNKKIPDSIYEKTREQMKNKN